MAAVDPAKFLRRSFIYRRLAAAGARFEVLGDAAVAMDLGDPAAELNRARVLGLADLSPLPRTGFKGTAALSWLAEQGVSGLGKDNYADGQGDGALAARLAVSEALIIADIANGSDLCDRLDTAHDAETPLGCHRVLRREASFHFVLAGTEAAAVMAKLCGVDLRTSVFPDRAIAQTSVARISMIVIGATLGTTPAFHLLGDSASAGYAWDMIIDAMSEFAGTPIGLGALRDLLF